MVIEKTRSSPIELPPDRRGERETFLPSELPPGSKPLGLHAGDAVGGPVEGPSSNTVYIDGGTSKSQVGRLLAVNPLISREDIQECPILNNRDLSLARYVTGVNDDGSVREAGRLVSNLIPRVDNHRDSFFKRAWRQLKRDFGRDLFYGKLSTYNNQYILKTNGIKKRALANWFIALLAIRKIHNKGIAISHLFDFKDIKTLPGRVEVDSRALCKTDPAMYDFYQSTPEGTKASNLIQLVYRTAQLFIPYDIQRRWGCDGQAYKVQEFLEGKSEHGIPPRLAQQLREIVRDPQNHTIDDLITAIYDFNGKVIERLITKLSDEDQRYLNETLEELGIS